MSSNEHPHAAEIGLITRWLLVRALPFWERHALDDNGLAHEQLDFAGRPQETGYRRSMVQFRQIFVFARAASLGVCNKQVARSLFARVTSLAWRPEGGWVHRLDRTGNTLDATIDAYDQAFALLACAWVHALDRDVESLAWARRTLAFMDTSMREPSGGYAEAIPMRMPRRQNPHMHLFEAFLALYEVSGDPIFLARANLMRELLVNRFISSTGGLREYFAENWQPLNTPLGDLAEPGHHFEWAWLLHEHARVTGTPLDPSANALFDFAVAHGLDSRDLPIESISIAGTPVNRSLKLWASTEALKAHVARAESEGRMHDARIARIVRAMFELFLCHEGAPVWYEGVSEHGEPDVKRMPASTLYHLSLGFMEFLRWTGDLKAPGWGPKRSAPIV